MHRLNQTRTVGNARFQLRISLRCESLNSVHSDSYNGFDIYRHQVSAVNTFKPCLLPIEDRLTMYVYLLSHDGMAFYIPLVR